MFLLIIYLNFKYLQNNQETLNELSDHPFVGTGKPEPLKYELAGFWSRRINREHRLVYQVGKEKVLIYSAKGHYL
jgi:toxin YoeB